MAEYSLPVLLLIFGLSMTALMKGADALIDGASGLARKWGVSNLIIGLTVIALGTSLPELVVSLQAAFASKGALALANVVGSNITNILMVIGATAMMQPLVAPRSLRGAEIPFSLLLGVVFLGMIAFSLENLAAFGPGSHATLYQWGGGVLLGFFLWFVVRLVIRSRSEPDEDEETEETEEVPRPVLKVLIGTALIIAGGRYTVLSATGIAKTLGVSDTTIGLTIVAFGTSLPELVASVVAARRGFADMAIGNVIGSNIMNLALVLGAAGIVAPISVSWFESLDIVIMTLVSLQFLWLCFRDTKPHVGRATGVIYFFSYIAYMIFVAMR